MGGGGRCAGAGSAFVLPASSTFNVNFGYSFTHMRTWTSIIPVNEIKTKLGKLKIWIKLIFDKGPITVM